MASQLMGASGMMSSPRVGPVGLCGEEWRSRLSSPPRLFIGTCLESGFVDHWKRGGSAGGVGEGTEASGGCTGASGAMSATGGAGGGGVVGRSGGEGAADEAADDEVENSGSDPSSISICLKMSSPGEPEARGACGSGGVDGGGVGGGGGGGGGVGGAW
jgi:hypothetical protein